MIEDLSYPDWQKRAARMVDNLELSEGPIASAMRSLPRHWFLPRDLWAAAYMDTPLPVGPEATISAPHMVAIQLATAQVREGQCILEVGSGSGYLVALAALLVGAKGFVVGIEVEPALVESSRSAISRLGLSERVCIHRGDGTKGDPGKAPYDSVLVSYAIRPPLPRHWEEQLKVGGLVVAPVDRGDGTFLECLEKLSPRDWNIERGPPCMFVSQK
jgi:protein-L-isoaspartate(D-aspartate) O-methyltransferase